jgi:hypothetical protein
MSGELVQIAELKRPIHRVNIYRFNFSGRCPVNGESIAYRLRIESPTTIMAEGIEWAIKGAFFKGCGLHEEIADELHTILGGKQRLTAWHSGVHVLTVRG